MLRNATGNLGALVLAAWLCVLAGCEGQRGLAERWAGGLAPGAGAVPQAGADVAGGPRIVAQASAPGGFTLRVWADSLLDGASLAGCALTPVSTVAAAGDMAQERGFEIAVQGAQGLKALLCDVEYDTARWHPVQLEVLPQLGAPDETLSLGHFAEAGRAYAGGVLRHYASRPGISGDGALMRIRFAAGTQPEVRTAAKAPLSAADSARLSWSAGQSELQWDYRCTGDYDQDGRVGLTDMVPIALYYGDVGPGLEFPDATSRGVADGNHDGKINLADLTPLGTNWGVTVLGGYSVYRSQDAADYPADAASPSNPALKLGAAALGSGSASPGQRKRFAYSVADPAAGDCYWVRPNDGAVDGVPSTLAHYAPSAAGAWPMAGHDPQRTNCSQYVGPANPEVAWTYRPEGGAGSFGEASIGPDGTVYATCSDELHAYYPNGGLKWAVEGVNALRKPTVAPDGNVYIDHVSYSHSGHEQYALLALDTSGALRWELPSTAQAYSAAGQDSTIYVTCADNLLRAINPDGTLKWSFDAGIDFNSPAVIGRDGSIYLNTGAMVYKFAPDGVVLWQCDIVWGTLNPPVEAPDGTVYIANDLSLIGINPNGTARFQYKSTDGWVFNRGPAVGADNTAYVQSSDGPIYAVSPSGALRWKYDMAYDCNREPVIDPQGRICFVANGCLERLDPCGALESEFSLKKKFTTYPTYNNDRMYIADPQLQVIDSGNNVIWHGVGSSSVGDVIALGGNGTIYIDSLMYPYGTSGQMNELQAISPDGELMWGYPHPGQIGSPVLSSDGSIICSMGGSSGNNFTCLTESGALRWGTYVPDYQRAPVIIVNDQWSTTTSHGVFTYDNSGSSIASYLDNEHYDSYLIGIDSFDNYVLMKKDINLNKLDSGLLLVAQDIRDYFAFCIGTEGMIYAAYLSTDHHDTYIAALKPDLSEQWQYCIPKCALHSKLVPALGPDGTLYCVITENELADPPPHSVHNFYVDCILALNPDGSLKWKSSALNEIVSNITVDAANNCYVVCNDGTRSYAPDGHLRWHIKFFNNGYSGSGTGAASPVIGADGTLYVVNSSGRLYALRDP